MFTNNTSFNELHPFKGKRGFCKAYSRDNENRKEIMEWTIIKKVMNF